MPLVKMQELLKSAEENNYAVGSFAVGNMEMLTGVLAACEESSIPVILSVNEASVKDISFNAIGSAVVSGAKEAKVPVAVIFEGAKNSETVKKALSLGFDSIMYDGSHLSLGENIKAVKEIRALTNEYNAYLEAKVVSVFEAEDEQPPLTLPDDAKLFCDETGVDAVSVAVGFDPKIENVMPAVNFDVLNEVNRMVEKPLTVEIGRFISDEIVRQTIMLGVRKITISEELFKTVAENTSELCKNRETLDFSTLRQNLIETVFEKTKRYLKVLNMQSELLGE